MREKSFVKGVALAVLGGAFIFLGGCDSSKHGKIVDSQEMLSSCKEMGGVFGLIENPALIYKNKKTYFCLVTGKEHIRNPNYYSFGAVYISYGNVGSGKLELVDLVAQPVNSFGAASSIPIKQDLYDQLVKDAVALNK